MPIVSIELDSGDLETKGPQFAAVLKNLPSQWIREGAEIHESQMYIEVSSFIQSGKMQSSIRSEIHENWAEIGTNSGYGKAVDQGRRGFDVYPKNPGGFLRFFWNGKIVYAKESHPGPAKGHFFTKSTMINSRARMLSMMSETYLQNVSQIK